MKDVIKVAVAGANVVNYWNEGDGAGSDGAEGINAGRPMK
jgi:hypothetical protein